jgi:hypothetical protein
MNDKRIIIMYTEQKQKQSRAEQSRAEQSRAEQSRAEQSRAEQSRAEICSIKKIPKLQTYSNSDLHLGANRESLHIYYALPQCARPRRGDGQTHCVWLRMNL